jgi:hypothetical protein
MIAEAIKDFKTINYDFVLVRQDPENEETMLVFFDPRADYCVNVLISRHLHENQRRRKEAVNGTP